MEDEYCVLIYKIFNADETIHFHSPPTINQSIYHFFEHADKLCERLLPRTIPSVIFMFGQTSQANHCFLS